MFICYIAFYYFYKGIYSALRDQMNLLYPLLHPRHLLAGHPGWYIPILWSTEYVVDCVSVLQCVVGVMLVTQWIIPLVNTTQSFSCYVSATTLVT